MRNEILTREQNAYYEFMVANSTFIKQFNYEDEAHLNEFIDGFVCAVSFFGVSELEFRKHDRSRSKIGVNRLMKAYKEKGSYFNTKGLQCLKLATNELNEFGKSLQYENRYRFGKNDIRNEFLSFFEELEIKPTDVDKLIKVLDETLSECSKSPEQTINYILLKVEGLKKLRNSEDRGAVDNIPIWKIVAIAIYIGLSSWAVWRCVISRRGCGTVEGKAYYYGTTIAKLISKFC